MSSIRSLPWRIAFAVCLPLALAACGESDVEDPTPADMPPIDEQVDGVTWHSDIAPIVAQRCAGCHDDGGVAPFAFDTFESASAMAQVALSSIDAGRMPPWLPDPDCRDFEDARIMPASEVELFRAWVEAGTPEGDASQAAPIEPAVVIDFEPTHVASPIEAYVPDAGLDDDYRCFILDAEFAEDTFLTASRVVPDADALVHHVLVYAIEADEVDQLVEADASEPGSGYTCFGGPFPEGTGDVQGGGGLPTQIAAWVPGSVPQVFPEGIAVPIGAGSKIVMQVHYNLIASATEPDATTLEMKLTDETPTHVVATRPLLIRDLDIPAGSPEATNRTTFRNYSDQPIVLASVAAHMHLLGKSLKSVIERADGSEECLLDIPAWDFSWQQGYRIARDEWVSVAPGEALTLECVYDNSQANQPFVDGEQIAPNDVSWGEGTLDEMCMMYMTIIRPYVPPAPAEDTCTPDSTCLDTCAADGRGTADCLVKCSPDSACTVCTLRETIGCGGASCIAPFTQLRNHGCLTTCFVNTMMIGGDTTACFDDLCPDEYAALSTCMGEVLDSGSCDEAIDTACGIDISAR